MHHRYRRLGVVLVGLACLFAAFSASAFAAGKPIVPGTVSEEWAPNFTGPNHDSLDLQVNPNGAATTVTIKYRKVGDSTWTNAVSQNIGSGTGLVEVIGTALPLERAARYEAIATAENSYGVSTTPYSLGFSVRLKAVHSAPLEVAQTAQYSSYGTVRVEYITSIGTLGKIECEALGGGEFGPEAIGGEHLHLDTSNCAMYYESWQPEFVCSTPAFDLSFNKVFVAEEKRMRLCPEEGVSHALRFQSAFSVNTGSPSVLYTELPVTMTAPITLDSLQGTATFTGIWKLTGSQTGWSFKLTA